MPRSEVNIEILFSFHLVFLSFSLSLHLPVRMATDTNDEPAMVKITAPATAPLEIQPMSVEDGPAERTTDKLAETAGTSPDGPPSSPPTPPPPQSYIVLRWLKKLDYVPKRCRWDPEAPPTFGWPLCFLFALVRGKETRQHEQRT